MNDEELIRALVRDWLQASRDGDTDAVLGLMTDDVVFLVPGQPPFGKAAFERRQQGPVLVDSQSEIEEIQMLGDWAFMRTRLRVVVQAQGDAPEARTGRTLTVLRKQDGRWRIARDANLLVPEADGTGH